MEGRLIVPACNCGAEAAAATLSFIAGQAGGAEVQPNHAGTCPAADDWTATKRTIESLRADPERAVVAQVVAALATATKGTPAHYTWNKLWWLLYVPEPPKPPKAKARRKKRP